MKPYERRATGAYPYYVLAKWNHLFVCFQDGGETFPSKEAAMKKAEKTPGTYRIAKVNEDGKRRDLPIFSTKETI